MQRTILGKRVTTWAITLLCVFVIGALLAAFVKEVGETLHYDSYAWRKTKLETNVAPCLSATLTGDACSVDLVEVQAWVRFEWYVFRVLPLAMFLLLCVTAVYFAFATMFGRMLFFIVVATGCCVSSMFLAGVIAVSVWWAECAKHSFCTRVDYWASIPTDPTKNDAPTLLYLVYFGGLLGSCVFACIVIIVAEMRRREIQSDPLLIEFADKVRGVPVIGSALASAGLTERSGAQSYYGAPAVASPQPTYAPLAMTAPSAPAPPTATNYDVYGANALGSNIDGVAPKQSRFSAVAKAMQTPKTRTQ